MTTSSEPLDAASLLSRSFAMHGIQASPWSLVEACRGDLSLTGFASCARQQGLEAEVVELKSGDVLFLTPGAIVEQLDGARRVLVEHSTGGAVLESATGERRLGAAGDGAFKLALELRPNPPAEASFLDRLLFRLGREPHAPRAVLVASILALVLLGLGLAGPVLTRMVLGAALPDRAEGTLALLAATVGFVGAQVAVVGWLRRRAVLYLETKLAERASVDVVAQALRMPYAALARLDVGAIRQACSSAASAAGVVTSLAPQVVDALLGFAYLVYTFAIDPVSGLITAGAGTLALVSGAVNGRRLIARKRTLLAATRTELDGLYEVLVGVETVKSESVEGKMLARWLDRLLLEERAALDVRLASSTFATVFTAGERIVFGAVLLLLARRCLEHQATVADLMAAVQASASFMACVQKLAVFPMGLASYRGDVERVEEILTAPSERRDGGRARPSSQAPALVLRDVWFRYEPDAPWVLSGLDLVVEQGQRLILAWPSGAGKSTLLRLLSGLLPPTRGDVLVFGTDAENARRMVAYLPQNATLFPMSLLENLRILSGGAPAPRILAAAEATGLLEIVSRWGMGMNTVIALGGANISSGQRQLVLLTAAVASEAPLLLLDEAMAHMDLGIRARIDASNLFEGRTVISVVHDVSPREAAGARVVALAART